MTKGEKLKGGFYEDVGLRICYLSREAGAWVFEYLNGNKIEANSTNYITATPLTPEEVFKRIDDKRKPLDNLEVFVKSKLENRAQSSPSGTGTGSGVGPGGFPLGEMSRKADELEEKREKGQGRSKGPYRGIKHPHRRGLSGRQKRRKGSTLRTILEPLTKTHPPERESSKNWHKKGRSINAG